MALVLLSDIPGLDDTVAVLQLSRGCPLNARTVEQGSKAGNDSKGGGVDDSVGCVGAFLGKGDIG